MTDEKRRSLFLGLFAMAIGIGFGWPLADDVSLSASRYRRSRGGRRAQTRFFAEYIAFVLNAGIAVGGMVVGSNSLLKLLKKD